MAIKHMLIDLGDVLYKIDIQRTKNAFLALAPEGNAVIDFSKAGQHKVFTDLEVGRTDPKGFVEAITNLYGLTATEAEVLDAWNQILVQLVPERPKQLEKLAQKYTLALLSNTNIIHFEYYKEECAPAFAHLSHLFLSYEMGMRKPDAEIFETALAHMNWKAEETLFVDDSPNNIQAAKELGLATFWMERVEDFDRLMEEYA